MILSDCRSLVRFFRCALPVAAMVWAFPVPAIAASCDAPDGKIETAICGDEEMRALDARIAARYEVLLAEMDAEGAAALREDQQWYLSTRDDVLTWLYEDPDDVKEKFSDLATEKGETVEWDDEQDWGEVWREVLHGWLQARAFVLDAMVARPEPGVEGLWTNAGGGEVLIAANEDGGLSLLAHVDETLFARWACNAEGKTVRPEGPEARFVDADVPGWNILARRVGAALQVEEQRDDGEIASSPWCGLNGGIKGRYFQISVPSRP